MGYKEWLNEDGNRAFQHAQKLFNIGLGTSSVRVDVKGIYERSTIPEFLKSAHMDFGNESNPYSATQLWVTHLAVCALITYHHRLWGALSYGHDSKMRLEQRSMLVLGLAHRFEYAHRMTNIASADDVAALVEAGSCFSQCFMMLNLDSCLRMFGGNLNIAEEIRGYAKSMTRGIGLGTGVLRNARGDGMWIPTTVQQTTDHLAEIVEVIEAQLASGEHDEVIGQTADVLAEGLEMDRQMLVDDLEVQFDFEGPTLITKRLRVIWPDLMK